MHEGKFRTRAIFQSITGSTSIMIPPRPKEKCKSRENALYPVLSMTGDAVRFATVEDNPFFLSQDNPDVVRGAVVAKKYCSTAADGTMDCLSCLEHVRANHPNMTVVVMAVSG